MRLVLLGAPGSGKGTQCKRVVAKYGLSHLSSGDILRQERAQQSELGNKAQEYMDSGALVPDDLIVEMMAGAIKKASKVGFVLDGFPRTVNQAVELDKSLNQLDNKIDLVINLKIDDQVVLSRMTGRRSCPQCGAVYHIENLKPRVKGKCDIDETELVQRPDDTAEVVSNRLEIYHQQTEQVADYYRKEFNIYDIDADKEVDLITNIIFEKLDAIQKA
ncbi:MAG: adenylate kinase [Planctomycetota bacterium]|jgi:adenylate kinase